MTLNGIHSISRGLGGLVRQNGTVTPSRGSPRSGQDFFGEFIQTVRENVNNPSTDETFMEQRDVFLEEVDASTRKNESDMTLLDALKAAVEAAHKKHEAAIEADREVARCLSKLWPQSTNSRAEIIDDDARNELTASFSKFSVMLNVIADLDETMNKARQKILLYPLQSFSEVHSDSARKACRKKVYDASKRYDKKYKARALDLIKRSSTLGVDRDPVRHVELYEETMEERTGLQLQLCEFFINISRIERSKGVDLSNHLVNLYNSLLKYYHDGLEQLSMHSEFVDGLKTKLDEINHYHEPLVTLQQDLHKIKPPKSAGLTTPPSASKPQVAGQRHGYLNKRYQLGRTGAGLWQKRKCMVAGGRFYIYHSDEKIPPRQILLAACKICKPDDDKATDKEFDIITPDKRFQLQAVSAEEAEAWMASLTENQQYSTANSRQNSKAMDSVSSRLRALIDHRDGRYMCADCRTVGPENDITWLSARLGAVLCINCIGVHRGGVSAVVKSLDLDLIHPHELVIAACIGNTQLNKVLEHSITSSVCRYSAHDADIRRSFIRRKYVDKEFAPQSWDRYIDQSESDTSVDDVLYLFATGKLAEGMAGDKPLLHHLVIRATTDHTLENLACVALVTQHCPDLLTRKDADGYTPVEVFLRQPNHSAHAPLLYILLRRVDAIDEAERARLKVIARDCEKCCGLLDASSSRGKLEDFDVELLLPYLPSPVIVPGGLSDGAVRIPVRSENKSPPNTLPRPKPRQHSAIGVGDHLVRALFDCSADASDELSFHKDDLLVVVDETAPEEPEWMKCFRQGDKLQRMGMVPKSFVTYAIAPSVSKARSLLAQGSQRSVQSMRI